MSHYKRSSAQSSAQSSVQSSRIDYLRDSSQIAYILRATEALGLAMADSQATARAILDLCLSRPSYSVWRGDSTNPLTFDAQVCLSVAQVMGVDMTGGPLGLDQA